MADKVLLIDDDESLIGFLKDYLEAHGYQVVTALGGRDALRVYFREKPDLVLLDIMMPTMDGWEVCARLRELSEGPIIMLTARTAEADKLHAFRLGVDDYVTKPFSFPELVARMQAVLTRSRMGRMPTRRVYVADDLVVDLDRRTVKLGSTPIALTPTEFRLLASLAQREGLAVSEATLAQETWGSYKEGDTTAVRRYIWLLRQKLESRPEHPTRIVTVRGFGYRLTTAPMHGERMAALAEQSPAARVTSGQEPEQ